MLRLAIAYIHGGLLLRAGLRRGSPSSARAPLRNTSENAPGWDSLMRLSWVMAYHSFGGEVEASNTPTIRRLTPSRRHQLPRITPLSTACTTAVISFWHTT